MSRSIAENARPEKNSNRPSRSVPSTFRSVPSTFFAVGRTAVRHALACAANGKPANATSIAIIRKPGKVYATEFRPIPVQQVAKNTKSMPDSFIAKNGHDVTPAFLRYAAPIVGPLPYCEVF